MLTGLVLGAALAAVCLRPWLADMQRTGLSRENYRGAQVAFPSGAALVAVSLLALAPLAVLDDRADKAREARMKGYEGDSCGECGNFTLVRNGTCLKCDTCGSTSGCS